MNGIFVVDKPSGWTSQDVCSKLRGALHVKRVGHSGTLDPMATGVLTVFVGRATRAVEFAESDEKRYTAALRLGTVTDTQDITGTVLSTAPAASREELLAVLPEFTGELMQTPPMYSAVKINGRKLYELARRGETVERAARRITIRSIELIDEENDNGDFLLDVTCSKGTYIRTLCSDIGERLGCGGAMSALRRTAAGPFTLADAHTLDEILETVKGGAPESLLLPVDTLFRAFPAVTASAAQERRIRCGNVYGTPEREGTYRVYSESGEFLMLGKSSGGNMVTVKSFFEPA